MQSGEPSVPTTEDWLADSLSTGQAVGVDPYLVSTATARALQKKLQNKSISLVALPTNPVDLVWHNHPARSMNPAKVCECVHTGWIASHDGTDPVRLLWQVHPLQYAGTSHSDKVVTVQAEVARANACALVVRGLLGLEPQLLLTDPAGGSVIIAVSRRFVRWMRSRGCSTSVDQMSCATQSCLPMLL